MRIIVGRDAGKTLLKLIDNAKSRIWIITPYISRIYALKLLRKALDEGVEVKLLIGSIPRNRGAINAVKGFIPKKTINPGIVGLTYGFALLLITLFLFIDNYSSSIISSIFGDALIPLTILLLISTIIITIIGNPILISLVFVFGSIAFLYPYVCNLMSIEPFIRVLEGMRFALDVNYLYSLTLKWIEMLLLSLSIGLVCYAIYLISKGQKLKVKAQKFMLRTFNPNRGFIHSKIYIIDDIAVIGSPNLTVGGLRRNIEAIVLIDEVDKVKSLEKTFVKLWSRYGVE